MANVAVKVDNSVPMLLVVEHWAATPLEIVADVLPSAISTAAYPTIVQISDCVADTVAWWMCSSPAVAVLAMYNCAIVCGQGVSLPLLDCRQLLLGRPFVRFASLNVFEFDCAVVEPPL